MKTVQRRLPVPKSFADEIDRMDRIEKKNFLAAHWAEGEGRIKSKLIEAFLPEIHRNNNLMELSLRTSFGQETDAKAVRRQLSILEKIFPI